MLHNNISAAIQMGGALQRSRDGPQPAAGQGVISEDKKPNSEERQQENLIDPSLENETGFLSQFHLTPFAYNVYKATSRANNESYLLKKLPSEMMKELELMKSFSHPNYLKLYDVRKFETTASAGSIVYGVFEYQSYEGLDDRINMEGKFSEDRGAIIIKQLCSVVDYLHAKSLFHLDLKLANILVPKGGDVPIKLSDLGWALTDHTDSMSEMLGTPYFVSPELLKGEIATTKVDVWSIGIICYILLSRFPPFRGRSSQQLMLSIIRNPVTFEIELSQSSKKFIELCLEKHPSERPLACELLALPWLTHLEGNNTEGIVDEETLRLFVGPPREYPPVFNEYGATYGIQFRDLVELFNSYARTLNQPMTRDKLPGCQPLYGGLSAHHLREYFVHNKMYPPTDPGTSHLFIKCDLVHVAISYVWKLPLLGLLDLLRGDMRRCPVHGEEVVWLDVLVIDQNAPDITKALEVSKQVYERSDRHFVLTVSCFDRTWCLYEMYLRLMSSENDASIGRSEMIEFRTVGGSEDEKAREKTLCEMGVRNMLQDMQAYLAEDREAVRSRILNTTSESRFNGMMRAIYAEFARRRRCSSLMQLLICYYMGGTVSDPLLLERYLSGEDVDLHAVHVVSWPDEESRISSREFPVLRV